MKYLFVIVLFSGCSVFSGEKWYHSINGEKLRLKSGNRFEFTDVIDYGHKSIYVHSKGSFSKRNDTIFLDHRSTNVDSLYHKGKKIKLQLPAYVVQNAKSTLLLLKNGQQKELKKYSRF